MKFMVTSYCISFTTRGSQDQWNGYNCTLKISHQAYIITVVCINYEWPFRDCFYQCCLLWGYKLPLTSPHSCGSYVNCIHKVIDIF